MLELILDDDYEAIDSSLPESIRQLKQRGSHRCWHKRSTFLQHLVSVHNMLRLWEQSKVSARVGLFHSAYSNSYVNLALLNPQQPSEYRAQLQTSIGAEAADVVYKFCIINRQVIVVETLLAQGAIPPQGIVVSHYCVTLQKPFIYRLSRSVIWQSLPWQILAINISDGKINSKEEVATKDP